MTGQGRRAVEERVSSHERWLSDGDGVQLEAAGLDLRGVDLGGRVLSEALLVDCDLSGASLTGAWLVRTLLVGCRLEDADLGGARLDRAVATGAHARGVSLRGASLVRVDLDGADLRGADLRRAWLLRASLAGTDLRAADLRETDLDRSVWAGTRVDGATVLGGAAGSVVVPGPDGVRAGDVRAGDVPALTADGTVAWMRSKGADVRLHDGVSRQERWRWSSPDVPPPAPA